MKRNRIWLLLLTALVVLCVSCGEKREELKKKRGKMNDELKLKGDKTVYGLACEGCNDSVIVLLPNDGSDPVKYDIIDAHANHKIMGTPRVGDWMGLVLNAEDSTVADFVVDLDELKGTWCYVVMPKMRDYEKMSPKLQRRMMREMPDSIKQTYMIPREYGFTLKRQWTAQSEGYIPESQLDADNPVEYPQLGFFTGWHIWNGKLVMTSRDMSAGPGKKAKEVYDTCDIDYLKDDSLVLSSEGISRGYYRKNPNNDLNKKARAIADQQQQKALEEIKNK